MELTKNIFFNTDKLVENSNVKISYTGKFFQDNSEEVFIHYGFGLNWDNLNDIKMEKTELGFQAEIFLCEGETFNFCFKNGNDEWDNNDGKNYIFNLMYEILAIIVPFITTPYISRVLGATAVGDYNYINGIVSCFGLIVATGTATFGNRGIAVVQNDKKKRSVLFYEIFILRVL